MRHIVDKINVYVYYAPMCCVLQVGMFSVYVYREVGGKHHLPNCHLRWSDGPPSSEIALPSLEVLAGRPLPRSVRKQLFDHLEEIWAEWVRLNSVPDQSEG